jgi:hypothetical protein
MRARELQKPATIVSIGQSNPLPQLGFMVRLEEIPSRRTGSRCYTWLAVGYASLHNAALLYGHGFCPAIRDYRQLMEKRDEAKVPLGISSPVVLHFVACHDRYDLASRGEQR